MPTIGGDLYAILAAFIWGLNYPLVKLVLLSIRETDFLLIRFTSTVILLVIYLVIVKENFKVEKQYYFRILLLGTLGVGVYNIVWTHGIHNTTAANAALLISTSPIFTGIYAVITREEKVSLSRWIGTLLAFFGIYLIIKWTPGTQFSFSSNSFIGNILILLGSILFSLYSIVAKPLLVCYSPTKVTALAMVSGLPILIIYSILQGEILSYSVFETRIWLEMAYIIVFGTIIAFVLWYKGIKQTSPVKTVFFHYIVPVMSMVFGAIILGEKVLEGQIIGAAFVFLGLLAVKCDFQRVTRWVITQKSRF
ncbi:EamA family transporter|uniref:Permease of the drug/metabolite transporter (DMT) superfamily n=1 Tax=Dendrosporobacter quercicolus TaxID=146817 RepID=A0A1G9VWZ2_9FIRM|nr:DMT family transporter [Dendrosporobacter quercicolus]NSL47776.1 EamA family transporter [Dendrosporobacter quercicolus DSM 1736]SDM76798.1 Permease of the drug/metabolite transporter (DMT) superfamily [Dendrosporobacter quercicolus]